MTLQQLWLGIETRRRRACRRAGAPYGYSQFCDLYAAFRGRVDLSMRQVHRAGEKVFIDYSGKKPVIWSTETGEAIEVELYVAVLERVELHVCRGDAHAAALEDFCARSTVRAFEFFGGVPQIAVPDQLRSTPSAGPIPATTPTSTRRTPSWRSTTTSRSMPARPAKPRGSRRSWSRRPCCWRSGWILACLQQPDFLQPSTRPSTRRSRSCSSS